MKAQKQISVSASTKRLFADALQRKRYLYALLMIFLMVTASEFSNEKEIIFPEIAALTIGLWIVQKRVWIISKPYLVLLMTIGAVAGICIARYSPFPLIVNLCLAFLFAAVLLTIFRVTLIPLVSACMLPVLLHTESWIYPEAVFIMSLILITGQTLMEKSGNRKKIEFTPINIEWKKELYRWLFLLVSILSIMAIPVYTSNIYCILPPLVVTYVEFANSKAGFRNRPVQVFSTLVIAAVIGSVFQLIGHVYLHIPIAVLSCLIFICLFSIFEWMGKFFAPAGAIALIPMIIPQEDLIWFPFQIAIGSALFITTAMILFLKCYKWPKAQLIVCFVPDFLRAYRK